MRNATSKTTPLPARPLPSASALEERLRHSEHQLALASEAAGLGLWSWNLLTDQLTWTTRCKELFGLSADAPVSYPIFLSVLHPDDRAMVDAAVHRAIDEKTSYSVEMRVLLPNGGIRWLNSRGRAIYDDDGMAMHFMGVVADISDRKIAEEQLRRSNDAALAHAAEMHLITDLAPAFISFCDTDFRYLFVNHPYAARFGLQPEQCIGKHVREVLGETVFAHIEPHLRRVLAGETVEFEMEAAYPGVGRSDLWCVFAPGFDEYGRVKHFVAVVRDITERKRVDRELQDSERRFHQLANSVPGFVWTSGPDGLITFINDRWFEYTGIERDTSPDDVPKLVMHPDDQHLIAAWDHAARADEAGPYVTEFRNRRHDGEYRWFMTRAVPQKDAGGRLIGWFGTSIDIHERKLAEEALQNSETRFHRLADSIPAFVWTAGRDGVITYINDRWFEYTGIDRDLPASQWPDAIIHPDDKPAHDNTWTAALESGIYWETEFRNRRHDGEYRWFLNRAVPRRDRSGKIIEWFGHTTEIHDRKLMEQALRTADRNKDEFLAMLAHELRNPLAPIRNGLEILKLGGSSSTTSYGPTHQMIERQIDHLTRLVDDLLDVSRITQGKVSLQQQKLDLRTLIEDAVEAGRVYFEQRRHQFELIVPGIPLMIEGDRDRLSQCIQNLLNNAAKYTPEGGRISLRFGSVGNEAEIRVKDSGQGIDPALRPHIFDLFTQGERTLDRSHGGLGIGLTLVRRLIELHGGSVEALSEGLGKGSEFVVRLPLANAEEYRGGAIIARAAAKHPAGGMRVLVVDDNRDAADSLGELIELWGHQAKVVHDGAEALELAAGYLPEAILLDIGLPGMNGYEVARRLRADDRLKDTFLVAMTGYGQEDDLRQAREACFDLHLVKPVPPEALRTALERRPRSK